MLKPHKPHSILTQEQTVRAARTGFPWDDRSKFAGLIRHQIDVEYDGVPVAVVVYSTGCGRAPSVL